jgi:hypothetical protein
MNAGARLLALFCPDQLFKRPEKVDPLTLTREILLTFTKSSR